MQVKRYPSPERAIAVFLCIFILMYAAYGLIEGKFYLPVRTGSALTLTGIAMLVPLIACAFVSISLLARVGLLLVSLQRSRTLVELLLLWVGVAAWLYSYWLAAGQLLNR